MNINDLPDSVSKIDMYLAFLSGVSTIAFEDLPPINEYSSRIDMYLYFMCQEKNNSSSINKVVTVHTVFSKSGSQTSGYNGDKITFTATPIVNRGDGTLPTYSGANFTLPFGKCYEVVVNTGVGTNNISGQGGYQLYDETTGGYVGFFTGISSGTVIPSTSLRWTFDLTSATSNKNFSVRFIAGGGVGVTLAYANIRIQEVK